MRNNVIDQQNTHISNEQIWQKMSSEVFILDESENRILKHLALNGPLNLNQIEKHSSRYTNSLGRWGVKLRLYGSSRFRGLIPYNFVYETNEPKHRFGKQEKKYHLTLKGILASYSTTPIEKNYFVIEYSDSLKNNTDPKLSKLSNFISSYFIDRIKLLLVWYFANGYQLQGQKTGGWYDQEILMNFTRQPTIEFHHSNKEIQDLIRTTLRNCIKSSTIISLIGYEMKPQLSMLSYTRPRSNKIKDCFGSISFPRRYFMEWPLYLGQNYSEETQKANRFRIGKYDLYSKQLVTEIDKELEELGFRINWHNRLEKEFR